MKPKHRPNIVSSIDSLCFCYCVGFGVSPRFRIFGQLCPSTIVSLFLASGSYLLQQLGHTQES